MNEKRLDAYLNLINELLVCSSGEESLILNANWQLVDAGLVKIMAQVADEFKDKGDQDSADFLIATAHLIKQTLQSPRKITDRTVGKGEALSTTKQEENLIFLDKLYQAISESNSEPQVVYPLLAANLDKLNDDFAQLLDRVVTDTLSQVEPEKAQSIAAVIGNFSNLIREFPLGDRASKLEIALASSKVAATIFTHEVFPVDWGIIQNNLGTIYKNRIYGNRAENLEISIACYTNALQIFSLEAFPQEWAAIQNNLANAYSERICGNKAENLEQAISCYQQALRVYTSETIPEEWAKTQNNLGAAYSNRIYGDKAQNLEIALRAYQMALKVRAREDLPEDWAATQSNLGIIYSNRIFGNKAENLEQAIALYINALQVYTREAFPQEWAMIQNNLAVAYRERIFGERAENLEVSIQAYQAALEVRTREALPVQWAATQSNLAVAYGERIYGDRAENLEQALACCINALQVYTREAFPEQWAATQSNLGFAYRERIYGDRTENLERAIICYVSALQIYTREAFPQYCAETLLKLGHLYQNAQQLLNAYNSFATAIGIVESLKAEIVSGDEVKQKLAGEWNNLYQQIVEVCLELGNLTAAIEYVERSKTRSLVELILNRDLKTVFPPEVVNQIEQLQEEITIGQNQLQTGRVENPTVLGQHLQQLRQKRNELQDSYLPIGYGFKFDQFQTTLDKQTVLLEWYATGEKLLTFIVTSETQTPIVWESSLEDQQALVDWTSTYFTTYYSDKRQWQDKLSVYLRELSEILHLNHLVSLIPAECQKLILIPHRFLHLFPLHTLPISDRQLEWANYDEDSATVSEPFYLLDRFSQGVSYAPSCQLLQLAQKRQRPNFSNFLAVQNPTSDLIFSDVEVESIQQHFHPNAVLVHEAATKDAIFTQQLSSVHCIHFACHGYFNLESPPNSALILADAILPDSQRNKNSNQVFVPREVQQAKYNNVIDLSKCLTLEDILSLNLDQCRLVTLSACETGLVDFNSVSDEYIGLPSGFLYAGSPSVVSSLWAVEDMSTAFLMIKFYENLQKFSSIAMALGQAQIWLRDVTISQLRQWIQERNLSLDNRLETFLQNYFSKHHSRKRIFANPYYWAAFTCQGLG
ncbi:CHAT domain-containing protein [Scytonema sp. PCC 10023]|uniref:CHAT domain-containing protein n=1 Tax=Scytonema sp. PCC 10023 TaxID=1680591 RepID=UPI0039C62E6A